MDGAFGDAVREVAPLSERTVAHLARKARPRRVRAGAHLLLPGEPCAFLGAVRKGLLREYYALPDGTERTKAFCFEGTLVGSLPDALEGGPSMAGVVAVENTELVGVAPDDLFAWGDAHDDAKNWMRTLLERLLLEKARRERELLTLDAWQRYQAFRSRYPGLEARVTQRAVATYLGVSPEHLSRIRRAHR